MRSIEHAFWHHPKTRALNHQSYGSSAEMYTAIKDRCAEHVACINMWVLGNFGKQWFTSFYNGGTTPTQTNLYPIADTQLPADIKALCLIMNINWRTQ